MKISKQQLVDMVKEELASEGRLVGAGMAKSLTDQLNGLASSLQKFDPSSIAGPPAEELRAAYIALQSTMDQVFGDSLENATAGGSTPLEECGMTDEPMPFPGPPPEGGAAIEPAYDDHEGRMAKSQLFKMSKYSNELLQMLEDHDQLPSWVQAKVTKAADYLGAVKHYMEYEKASPKTHGVNEAFEMVLAEENVNVLIDMIKDQL